MWLCTWQTTGLRPPERWLSNTERLQRYLRGTLVSPTCPWPSGGKSAPPSLKAKQNAEKRASLRAYWKAAQELWPAPGHGKVLGDALVFAKPDGSPMPPNSLTKEWGRVTRELKLPPVSFHSLRHTHASQLIASGMDVLTISRRLGHGSPTITLGVYGHAFKSKDREAAEIVERVFGGAATE